MKLWILVSSGLNLAAKIVCYCGTIRCDWKRHKWISHAVGVDWNGFFRHVSHLAVHFSSMSHKSTQTRLLCCNLIIVGHLLVSTVKEMFFFSQLCNISHFLGFLQAYFCLEYTIDIFAKALSFKPWLFDPHLSFHFNCNGHQTKQIRYYKSKVKISKWILWELWGTKINM